MKSSYPAFCISITLSLLTVAGCTTTPAPSKRDGSSDQCSTGVGLQGRDKVDLLFMIDNSAIGETVQNELRMRFPGFVKALADAAKDGYPVDLHIGVVTSDYGAGKTGAPGCTTSPGGDSGRLVQVGAAAPSACQPPMGGNFIQYDFSVENGSNNLPAGQDLATTFACMASVGSSGCGFEHPLESVYAALADVTSNAGFLRADATLAVVFATNSDDCSAPPDSDLFDKTKVSTYGYLSHYRCSRFGVACGGQLLPYGSSNGPLADCAPATAKQGGLLYPVQRYIDVFTKTSALGGIKDDPNDVILAGILTPPAPVEVILSDPGVAGGAPYPACSPLDETSNPPCVPVLQRSCQHKTQPIYYGYPTVRLDAVVRSVASYETANLCDADFSDILARLARRIAGRHLAGCLLKPIAPGADPPCTVEEIAPGTGAHTAIDKCRAGGPRPCWSLAQNAACAEASPYSMQLTVERIAPAPAGTQIVANCQTACPKPEEK